MKSGWHAIFRVEFRASLYFFLDMYVWSVAYIRHACQIPTETRTPCRRPTLVATADRQPVACRPRLSQLSPQSLHSPELPRLSFQGEASQLCPLWPPARKPFCGLCPRRTCAGGTPLFRQRACSAGSALPGRTAICQSLETGAGQGVEKRGELNRAENCEAADQFRRLGVAAAGHFAGAAAAEHLRFSGRPRRHEEMIEAVRRDLEQGLKNPGSGRSGLSAQQVLRSLILMRQELELSRAARTHRRRVHAAPVHRFQLSASTQA